MRRASWSFSVMLLAASGAWAAYDANGVALGASERDVRNAFPSAYCKPLEWQSRAADRRCDDAEVSFGGVSGRITFYLKKDAVQAFDLRFETRHLPRLKEVLQKRYGPPTAEANDLGKDGGRIYKARWESGGDSAVLVAPLQEKRSQLSVSRGNFSEEIYRVR